jgi:hypothetical protein
MISKVAKKLLFKQKESVSMNESADSRKANNEKKGFTIEDKLKKLQSAGLMSDVRDVISTGEAATGVAADTLDKTDVDKTIDAGNGLTIWLKV